MGATVPFPFASSCLYRGHRIEHGKGERHIELSKVSKRASEREREIERDRKSESRNAIYSKCLGWTEKKRNDWTDFVLKVLVAATHIVQMICFFFHSFILSLCFFGAMRSAYAVLTYLLLYFGSVQFSWLSFTGSITWFVHSFLCCGLYQPSVPSALARRFQRSCCLCARARSFASCPHSNF